MTNFVDGIMFFHDKVTYKKETFKEMMWKSIPQHDVWLWL